jgi:hypothetical protein
MIAIFAACSHAQIEQCLPEASSYRFEIEKTEFVVHAINANIIMLTK